MTTHPQLWAELHIHDCTMYMRMYQSSNLVVVAIQFQASCRATVSRLMESSFLFNCYNTFVVMPPKKTSAKSKCTYILTSVNVSTFRGHTFVYSIALKEVHVVSGARSYVHV